MEMLLWDMGACWHDCITFSADLSATQSCCQLPLLSQFLGVFFVCVGFFFSEFRCSLREAGNYFVLLDVREWTWSAPIFRQSIPAIYWSVLMILSKVYQEKTDWFNEFQYSLQIIIDLSSFLFFGWIETDEVLYCWSTYSEPLQKLT